MKNPSPKTTPSLNALSNESVSRLDEVLERSIIDLGIPPCPKILSRFMTEMSKDEPDYESLVSIIGTDISISAGLIKTANSPFFGLRKKVRSGSAALMVLGLKTTSSTVAGIILRNSFQNVPNLERFWDTTMRISLLSGWLAVRLAKRGLRAEDAYTFALFRDCGIPVLLGRFPNYQKVLDTANRESERSFTEVEENEIEINHAMVGNILARSWYLPEEIYLAIGDHHNITALGLPDSKLPLLSRKLIAMAQTAEQILQHQLGVSDSQEWQKMGETCLNILEIGKEQLELLYEEADSVITTIE